MRDPAGSLPVPGGLGVGTYRMSDREARHRAALALALDRGCRLVDTAPHYAGGRAEPLIRAVLAASTHRAFVVTKAGYVPDALAAELRIDPASLPRLDETTGYSVEQRVLRSSIARSRACLGVDRLDAVCVHNPERLGDVDGGEWTHERCEEAIATAFEELEAQVRTGAVGCYGVSSATLSAGRHEDQVRRLRRLVALAESVGGPGHHLRIVQFPWNLLEHPPGRAPLLEAVHELRLVSIAHRALNATWRGRQVRLADDCAGPATTKDAARRALEHARAVVADRLASIDAGYSPWDFAVMQFLRDQGDSIDHPDLVDLVFERQVRPFVARLFGEDGEASAGHAAFAALHAHLRALARERLAAEGAGLRAELAAAGRIDGGDDRPLAVIAASYPLAAGADHVVVGMRDVRHVEDFTPLMKEPGHGRDPAARERTSGRAVHLQLPARASQAG